MGSRTLVILQAGTARWGAAVFGFAARRHGWLVRRSCAHRPKRNCAAIRCDARGAEHALEQNERAHQRGIRAPPSDRRSGAHGLEQTLLPPGRRRPGGENRRRSPTCSQTNRGTNSEGTQLTHPILITWQPPVHPPGTSVFPVPASSATS